MKSTELKRLVAALEGLSADECLYVRKVLQGREAKVGTQVAIRELEQSVDHCPHCGCKELKGAGSKGGRKRFRCTACSKSFNAFTGTPLARLRMADRHEANAKCMVQGLSVRKTASKLGINVKTAFRWRHRFLEAMRDSQPSSLSGVVEADETFFLESFKGQRRGVPRPSKTRGTPAASRGLSKEQIPVLVARDRSSGATLTAKIATRKAKDIGAELLPRLSPDAVLCSDGASAYRIIGKTKGVEVRSVPAKKAAGVYHINNVNAYDSRLKGWMFRFKGVATKYLPNYLGWHRWLDADKKSGKSKRFLMASLG
jgi:transposase-like protein